jgi:D-alanyl-D-alanine-carboxypeptidase/D-alanyl-D-alanine-endopeptidase
MQNMIRACRRAGAIVALWLVYLGMSGPALADPLLDETVAFTGEVLFHQQKVPGLVIGALRDGELSVRGFGRRSDGSPAPDGDTLLRIGSITKVFTGEILARLVAQKKVASTDTLTKLVPQLAPGANEQIQQIRLIDLATHSSGLPRELPHDPGPDNDPFAPITRQAFGKWLESGKLLFAPGSGVLYSNFGYDLLALALAEVANKLYPALLDQNITGPLGLRDTTFEPNQAQKARMMQGHAPNGTPLPEVPTGSVIVGSGGLYSTANDLLRWMQWHLQTSAAKGAEARLLDHAIYLVRDGLSPVYGMDESGHMDAMGLGWVAMMPKEDRPFILQKAGGMQGVFTYIAFAPAHGVAVFVAINKFDFGAAKAMAEAANELIADLAPR